MFVLGIEIRTLKINSNSGNEVVSAVVSSVLSFLTKKTNLLYKKVAKLVENHTKFIIIVQLVNKLLIYLKYI